MIILLIVVIVLMACVISELVRENRRLEDVIESMKASHKRDNDTYVGWPHE